MFSSSHFSIRLPDLLRPQLISGCQRRKSDQLPGQLWYSRHLFCCCSQFNLKVPTNESVSTFTGQKSTLELIKLLVWEREAFFGLFLEIHNCTLCSQCQIEDSEDFVVQLIKISSFFFSFHPMSFQYYLSAICTPRFLMPLYRLFWGVCLCVWTGLLQSKKYYIYNSSNAS